MKKKPIKVSKSLSLDKETISKLDENQLNEVAGGGTTNTCNNQTPQQPVAQEFAADLIDINSCQACSCNKG
ncbi:class I lanthipeptide [Mucilaginibacter sp. KACC 22063]|uniref:class I lanthipeptide n=1 Tax=Mucilaginibacter sp. KACC 22063 TaxID=3025666 RepID=UPI00236709C6|nr:class I lanthipeptide [Mucilaginibacter sp. KACC 22063]WDF56040.1 class I lanthipeptide [Mucilaginibacter sp. KACC 22063]